MLSFVTRHFFLRKTETWFYNGETISETAYNSYPYAEAELRLPYDKKTEEETTILDLTLDDRHLFEGINATFRYHIRKAESMAFTCLITNDLSAHECDEVHSALQSFAAKRSFKSLSRKRLQAIRARKALFLMRIKKEDVILITHLYLGDTRRAVLLSSFHNEKVTDKRLQSYANKLLHWRAVLFFKQKNYSIYDFGGINKITVPGITRFKLSFGGQTERMTNYTRVNPALRPILKLAGII